MARRMNAECRPHNDEVLMTKYPKPARRCRAPEYLLPTGNIHA
jgi:hypothetical protein